LHIFVIGLRAFPNVPGGVETHAENLYPLIAQKGHLVTVSTRSPYHQVDEWSRVRFIRTWSPKSKFLEVVLHSILSVIKAAVLRPDVVHIHAVGPSLVAPLARIAGLRVVVTHHGPDYDREKWNWLAKLVLRIGEWCGMRFANKRIVISTVIADAMRDRYGTSSVRIPNGVRIPPLEYDSSLLSEYGLKPGAYVLMVSRFVPEKRHLDLIDAFEVADIPGIKLVLVGDADHPDDYERELKARAAKSSSVILTGFITGDTLSSVYQHAALFVLPSSHEGLPISLLEAASFGLPCIASGIPANRSVGLDESCYFPLGDIDALSAKIIEHLQQPLTADRRDNIRHWVSERYDWTDIAERTVDTLRTAVND
jgi:glycosyltransferase involved in cell wall biosynthesis|tara:strand:- start:57 stop:1157 length:1101 start_codon:yes stop_codon:yes gene_type:complete